MHTEDTHLSNILLCIISFVICSVISSVLILHIHILVGTQDIIFHSKMAMELKESIMHGNLLPAFSFNYFHGSSIMSMYPYLDLLPFSLILCFTSSIIHAYGYFFMIIIFISCNISYYSSLRFSSSKRISYIFSIVYSLSSTFILEVFSIGGLGVATSMAFAPLVIFGFIDILLGSHNYLKLSIGLLLMSLCELPAIVVTLFILFVWLLFNINLWGKTLKIFIKSGLLFVLLTSIVWIPMLNILLRNNDNTIVTQGLQGVTIKDFFLNISALALVALIIFVILKFNQLIKHRNLEDGHKRMLSQMGFVSLITIIVTSNIIPWKMIASWTPLNFLNQIQYTSRFLLIPQLLLCYLFSEFICKLLNNKDNKIIYTVLSMLCVIVILLQLLSQVYIFHKDSKYSYLNNVNYRVMRNANINGHILIKHKWNNILINGFLNNNDYYPKISNPIYRNINYNIGHDNYNHKIYLSHVGYDKFEFTNHNDSKRIYLPLLYYKGEHLKIYLNKKQVSFTVNRNGLVTLDNVNKGEYKLKVNNIPIMYIMILKIILFVVGLVWILIDELNKIKYKHRVIIK